MTPVQPSVSTDGVFAGKRVAMKQGNNVTYLHGDHLGSTSVTSGAITKYYAYGGVRAREWATFRKSFT